MLLYQPILGHLDILGHMQNLSNIIVVDMYSKQWFTNSTTTPVSSTATLANE